MHTLTVTPWTFLIGAHSQTRDPQGKPENPFCHPFVSSKSIVNAPMLTSQSPITFSSLQTVTGDLVFFLSGTYCHMTISFPQLTSVSGNVLFYVCRTWFEV